MVRAAPRKAPPTAHVTHRADPPCRRLALVTALLGTFAPLLHADPAITNFVSVDTDWNTTSPANIRMFNAAAPYTLYAPTTVGTYPWGTAFTPDGSKDYVTNTWNNTVSVINTATGAVIATIPSIEGAPSGVSVSPDGKTVLVVSTNATRIIDAATNAVIKTVPGIGQQGSAGGFTPDGLSAYVITSYSASTVSAINIASGGVTATIPVGNSGDGLGELAMSPNGSKLYGVDITQQKLYTIDLATQTVTLGPTIGAAYGGLAISPDGSKIYALNSSYGGTSGNVIVISTATGAVTGTIPFSGFPVSVQFSPDGSRAYVGNPDNNQNNVAVIDTSNNTVIATVAMPPPTVSPNSQSGAWPAGYFVGPNLITGNLSVASDAVLTNLGFGLNPVLGNSVNFAGGTLTATADFTTAKPVYLSEAYNLVASSGNPADNFVTAAGGTVDTAGHAVTFSGVVSGPGGLTKAGAGTLTLSAANTYTGGTNITGGTLQLGAGGSLANTGALTVDGGTFDLGGNSQTTGAVVLTSGAINNGNLTGSSYDVQSGSIGANLLGTAALSKNGSGTVILSGTNTYSGGTGIDGGTLVVSADNNLGASGSAISLRGGTLQAGASFNLGSTRAVTLVTGPVGSGGSGGTIDTNGYNLGFAGVISGVGSFTKAGSGTLTLSGSNTYTGATYINAGTLQLGTGGALPINSGLNVNGGTFDLGGNSQTMSGVLLNNGAINNGNLTTKKVFIVQSGSIGANLLGTATLGKSSSGTVILSGTNTYTGGTNIGDGILSVSADNNLGASGGAITFNGGTLQTGASFDLGSTRTVTFNTGGGTVDTNGYNLGFAGVLTGTGPITKTGAGTLTLTPNVADSYIGTVTISGGTLALNGAFTSSSSYAVNGGSLDLGGFSQNLSAVTLASGAINNGNLTSSSYGVQSGSIGANLLGAGTLTKTGSGTVTLTGTNTYSGGTTVSAGTLQGNSSSLQGAITNNANVVFDQASTGTYAGIMSGTGTLVKQNSGTLNLTGANTYTGATTINGGRLAVNGSLASAVTVNNGGTLGGNGTVGGIVANSGGTVAPGNSIGTQTVAGNVTFNAGSTYQVEANAAGQADRINAGGSTTLNPGANVSVVAATGNYQPRTTYTILNSTGGVSGAFGNAGVNLAYLTPTLSYDANDVFLTLQLNGSTLISAAATPNQLAVADALNSVAGTATGSMNTLINQLVVLPASQQQRALTTLGGQSTANLPRIQLDTVRVINQQLQSRMNGTGNGGYGLQSSLPYSGIQLAYDPPVSDAPAAYAGTLDAAPSHGFWLHGIGARGGADGDSNAYGYDYTTGGIAAGIDRDITDQFTLGVSGAYARNNVSFDTVSDSSHINSGYLNLYASYGDGPWHMKGIAGYGHSRYYTKRVIEIGSSTSIANGEADGNEVSAYGEVAYDIPLQSFTLQPVAGLNLGWLKRNSYNESGAGAADLSVDSQTVHTTNSQLGLRIKKEFGETNVSRTQLEAHALWSHEFSNPDATVSSNFISAPTAAFAVDGVTTKRDAAIVGAGIAHEVTRKVSLYADYNAELRGGGQDQQALVAGFRYLW